MKIVEYNDSYAQKVAEMWNKSNESWGNDESVKTKEDVIASETTSGNIKLYLAIDNDEVVGYCSLSEYKQDEGASYLPLLNVIPEYHGKKVGKKLILRVLEDAIKLEWPRFDLYTWSGNIKAMPLYKKCGFFWERKNDTVHLMNFMPYLHQTEAIEEYLAKLDWYKDSKRVIDMEHDGIAKNGFEYYRYDFENDQTKLAIEIEKTGRGIRFIETPDYSIEMTVKEHDLVFDTEYDVQYTIINKMDMDLDIKLIGKDNKNIKCDINRSMKVKKKEVIEEKFYLGEIKKDQQKGKTHPVVETEIYINGKKAVFKIGIEPKYPIKLKLLPLEYNHKLNDTYECYLDIENNLSSKEVFTIELPNTFVNFKDAISVEIEAKQKKSIPIKYSLEDFGFYKEEVVIRYSNKVINKDVIAAFKGAKKSFTCSLENQAWIVSGNYILRYGIENNSISLINSYEDEVQSVLLVPSIGKPYSLEFNNTVPVVEFKSDNDMDVTLKSNTFKGVEVVIHINHLFGLVTVNYELINKGSEKTLALAIPVWHHLKDNVVPFDGRLLDFPSIDGADISTLKHELVDENWVYNVKSKCGFSWDNNEKMKVSGWRFSFNKDEIHLKENESYISTDFCISYVHPTCEAFRAYAGNKGVKKHISLIELSVNEGNPFATTDIDIKMLNHRKISLEGSLIVDSMEVPLESTVSVSPGLKKIVMDMKNSKITAERMSFPISGNTRLIESDDILEVNNGVLSFKASRRYADSIYSLQFNNNEWLDSNYPTPKERVWWGDFIGGITTRCNGIEDNATLKEKRTIEFVELKDNFGNEWQGIKISLIILNDDGLKGLIFDTYCMTLAGVEVVHTFSNIINQSGKLVINKDFHRFNTLKIDDVAEDVIYVKGNNEYKCNGIGVESIADKLAVFKSNREYTLGVYNPSNELLVETQKGFLIVFSEAKLTIPDQGSKQFRGDFMIFSKEKLDKEMLQDLDNIRFEV